MAGMNGDQLFRMTRSDCVRAFGKTEGGRLFSQITISRQSDKDSNMKTVTPELRNILLKARQRAETEKREKSEDEANDNEYQSKV